MEEMLVQSRRALQLIEQGNLKMQEQNRTERKRKCSGTGWVSFSWQRISLTVIQVGSKAGKTKV